MGVKGRSNFERGNYYLFITPEGSNLTRHIPSQLQSQKKTLKSKIHEK